MILKLIGYILSLVGFFQKQIFYLFYKHIKIYYFKINMYKTFMVIWKMYTFSIRNTFNIYKDMRMKYNKTSLNIVKKCPPLTKNRN